MPHTKLLREQTKLHISYKHNLRLKTRQQVAAKDERQATQFAASFARSKQVRVIINHTFLDIFIYEVSSRM